MTVYVYSFVLGRIVVAISSLDYELQEKRVYTYFETCHILETWDTQAI